MRVAILHDYRDHRQPSMRLYAEQLGFHLAARGIDVHAVRPRPVLPEPVRKGWVLDKADSYLGRFLRYPRLARRLRADVFHVIDHGQAFLVPSLDPGRTVVTCHDVILLVIAAGRLRSPDVGAILAPAILRRSLQAMKGARRIVADSAHTRRDLARLVGIDPARVEVIYPGLNHPFGPDAARGAAFRARTDLPAGPLLLHVGHTGFYKNLEGCLRVLARLRRGGVEATLLRIGPPLTAAQARLARKLGVDGAERALGGLSPDDLADAYRAADCLLFPSLYEGFGWPAIEAMASGLPVVCSRAGSLDEVVGDAALTAEPEDVVRLADHVGAVLGDSRLAAALRERGREHARRFDWDATAGRFEAVYREVAEA